MSPPLTPSAGQARQMLGEELSKPEYTQSQVQNWLGDQLKKLFDWLTGNPNPGNASTLSTPQVATMVVIGVVIAAAAIWFFTRRMRLEHHPSQVVLDDEDRPATDLRADAAKLAEAGDWTQATLQLFRAMTRSLSERAIIDETTGMTAQEVASRAAVRLPALFGRMASAANVFDTLAYGHRTGTSRQYDDMLALDTEAAASTPTLPTPAGPPTPDITVEALP